jgi:predicted esterase
MDDHFHANTPILNYGVPLQKASAACILIHGRGASPADILSLASEIDPGGIAYLAPAARNNTWYPYSFLEPLERNQPFLDSALNRIGELLAEIRSYGIPTRRIGLLGFSQGACLTLEFGARNASRYGALIGFSGGLIGQALDRESYQASLEGTPVFLGCSEIDPHIPLERVNETGEILHAKGGVVDKRIYSNMGHTVNQDELDAAAKMLRELKSSQTEDISLPPQMNPMDPS